MNQLNPKGVYEHFSGLEDPRVLGRTAHKLIDIITITLCAVISGANTWVEIERYGKAKEDWFKKFLELPNSIPTQHTFRRIFIALSPEQFELCFLKWVRTVFEVTKSQVVPIDGKTLRGSQDNSNGKQAIPELIERLELEDCTVTIDAMGCQTKIADKIIEKNANYILALKENQSSLLKEVEMFFNDLENQECDYDTHITVDGDHGRIETRKTTAVSDINWLQGKEKFKGLKTIVKLETRREIKAQVSKESRYYITSLDKDAQYLSKSIRSHWRIENSLHWRLDVGFREDESRVRKGNSARNFAVMRHIALNLLSNEKTVKAGIHAKRLIAGWII